MTKIKRTSAEYARFEQALGRVLRVSKSDLDHMLAQEKEANRDKLKPGPKPKSSSVSDRASSEKG